MEELYARGHGQQKIEVIDMEPPGQEGKGGADPFAPVTQGVLQGFTHPGKALRFLKGAQAVLDPG
jgi:hypothetical protein